MANDQSPRTSTRRFGAPDITQGKDHETAQYKRNLTERLQLANRTLKATTLRYARGTYQMMEEVVLPVRSNPYGFECAGTCFVPIAMAFWAERQLTESELGRSRLIACTDADLTAARAMPSSPFLEQCLPGSRLVKVGDDLVRARGGKVMVDRFHNVAAGGAYPLIWVEPLGEVLTRIRRFALEINQGQRPMTLQFE